MTNQIPNPNDSILIFMIVSFNQFQYPDIISGIYNQRFIIEKSLKYKHVIISKYFY